jgi:hypothetical protein
VHEAPRTLVGVATTALEHPHLDCGVHLMGTPRRPVGSIGEAREALDLIPPEPTVDRLARDAEASCDLHDRDPVADHREHCLIPVLHDTQLHQHARECVADQAEPASPIRRGHVTHQPEPERDASGGTKHLCSSGGGIRTHNLRINSSWPRLGQRSDHPLAASEASHDSTSSHRYRR